MPWPNAGADRWHCTSSPHSPRSYPPGFKARYFLPAPLFLHHRHRHLAQLSHALLCLATQHATAFGCRMPSTAGQVPSPPSASSKQQCTASPRSEDLTEPRHSLSWLIIAIKRTPLVYRVSLTCRCLLEDPHGLGHLSDHTSSEPRRIMDLSPAPTFSRCAPPWAVKLSEPPPPFCPEMGSPPIQLAVEPACPPHHTAALRC
jgi:hypothetical protein